MTLGARLNRVLAQLLLEQHAQAIDYSRDHVSLGSGGHGSHGEWGKPSGNSRPLVVQWAERFEAMITSAEADVKILKTGAEPSTKVGTRTDTLRSRIRDYEGRDPVHVAYHEQMAGNPCSVETVRRIRRELGLRVGNGSPLERHQRPLTAPARDSLQILQDSVGGEL